MQICNVERDILFVMAHSNFTCVYHSLDRHYLSHIFLFFLSLLFIFIIYKKKLTKKQKNKKRQNNRDRRPKVSRKTIKMRVNKPENSSRHHFPFDYQRLTHHNTNELLPTYSTSTSIFDLCQRRTLTTDQQNYAHQVITRICLK